MWISHSVYHSQICCENQNILSKVICMQISRAAVSSSSIVRPKNCAVKIRANFFLTRAYVMHNFVITTHSHSNRRLLSGGTKIACQFAKSRENKKWTKKEPFLAHFYKYFALSFWHDRIFPSDDEMSKLFLSAKMHWMLYLRYYPVFK